MKILYINAITTQHCGDMLTKGVLRGLMQSQQAKTLDGVELISFDIFYGKKYSPQLMGVFARHHNVDAVILSGSEKNTTDCDDPFIKDYYLGLKDLLDFSGVIEEWTGPPRPVFGICFGHQALACALGGETARFESKIDVEKIHPLAGAETHPMLSAMVKKSAHNFKVVLYHADHVVKLPAGFRPLFTSNYCTIQGMAHDQWPLLSLQSHPEMTGLLKKDPIDGGEWDHVSLDDLDNNCGPEILAHFVDWAAHKTQAG